nr:cardiotrophin-2-like [Ovis aries]
MNERIGREVRDLMLTSDFFLPAPFCLLALLLPPLPLGAPMSTAESVKQAYNLALHMQTQTSTLLQTYLQHQSTPFSDPDFSLPELKLRTLPPTAMHFENWHGLEDAVRLSLTHEAFLSFSQHLLLAIVDQSNLNPDNSMVENQLWEERLKAKGLAGNLAGIMTALGLPTPPANPPLGTVPLGNTAFQKKCRGYVIVRDYGLWTDRVVTFLGELKDKYSQ